MTSITNDKYIGVNVMAKDSSYQKMLKEIGLINENMNVQLGKVYTDKDQPPFKTPQQIEEDDKEGKMAKFDAKEACQDAQDVFNMIDEYDDLPEWLEAKITKAADYLNSVKDYLTHHHNKGLGND